MPSPSQRKRERERAAVKAEEEQVFCLTCGHSKANHKRKGLKRWSNSPRSKGASIVETGCDKHDRKLVRRGRNYEYDFVLCTCLGFKGPDDWMRCPTCDGRGTIPRYHKDRFGTICQQCGSVGIVKRESIVA